MNAGELIQAAILYWCFGFVVGVAIAHIRNLLSRPPKHLMKPSQSNKKSPEGRAL